MTTEETRVLWEKYKAADRAGNADAIGQLYAEDVNGAGFPFRGRDAFRRLDSAFRRAFPDYQGEYVEEVIEGDKVAFILHYTATHTGRWLGMEPTGLKLDVLESWVFTVRDGHFAKLVPVGPDVPGMVRREANLQLVRRMYEAENAHDADAYGACLAPDFEAWGNGQLIRSGCAAQVAHMRDETFAGLPDWRNETLSLLADGNVVVARWHAWGTHSGPFGAIPASGRRMDVFATSTLEIEKGLIRRHLFDIDTSPLRELSGGPQGGTT